MAFEAPLNNAKDKREAEKIELTDEVVFAEANSKTDSKSKDSIKHLNGEDLSNDNLLGSG